jgi:hypothetical protein
VENLSQDSERTATKQQRQQQRVRDWFAARPNYYRDWTARNREWKNLNRPTFPKYKTGKLPYTINHTINKEKKD